MAGSAAAAAATDACQRQTWRLKTGCPNLTAEIGGDRASIATGSSTSTNRDGSAGNASSAVGVGITACSAATAHRLQGDSGRKHSGCGNAYGDRRIRGPDQDRLCVSSCAAVAPHSDRAGIGPSAGCGEGTSTGATAATDALQNHAAGEATSGDDLGGAAQGADLHLATIASWCAIAPGGNCDRDRAAF